MFLFKYVRIVAERLVLMIMYIHQHMHTITLQVVVVIIVFLGFRDKPRMYYSLAGLLYRPIWTFQVRPPDASAPADVSRTPCLHAC
jgi:hypothetical protein